LDPIAIFGEASEIARGSPKAANGPTDDFSCPGTDEIKAKRKASISRLFFLFY
jgi:hypothetical protein